MNPRGAPESFAFRLDGWPCPPDRLEWDGHRLWRQWPDRKRWAGMDGSEAWEAVIVPKAEAWAALAQVLEGSGVWEWPRKSVNLDILDGTQWSLKLGWGGRRWSGGGSNAFPPGFDAVHQALEALAGGRRVPGWPRPFSFSGEWEGWIWDFTWDGRSLSGTWEQWREDRRWPRASHTPGPRAWGPFQQVLKAAQVHDRTAGCVGLIRLPDDSGRPLLRTASADRPSEPWFRVASCLMDLLGAGNRAGPRASSRVVL